MKLLIFDDHVLFVRSLEVLLQDKVERIIHKSESYDYETTIKEYNPDIILMDIHLGNENGLDVGKNIRTLFPDTKLVFLSGYNLPEYQNQAKQLGAVGFINKNIEPQLFIQSLELVYEGHLVFPNDVSETINLTPKEKEILQYLSNGETQAVIADMLDISRRTVNNHIQSILLKLEVGSTVAAIVKGIELGIIKLNNNR